jgi:signal peptidase II
MFYSIIIIWVILDLITKNLANIYLQDKVNILWDFVYFQFVLNPWIAFWIEIYPLLLKIITISLIILIFYYYKYEKKENKNEKLIDLSFWLILAGAIWNWSERVINSNVIDFIWVKYFFVFNLADSFITIGAIIYLLILYKSSLLSPFSKGSTHRGRD